MRSTKYRAIDQRYIHLNTYFDRIGHTDSPGPDAGALRQIVAPPGPFLQLTLGGVCRRQ